MSLVVYELDFPRSYLGPIEERILRSRLSTGFGELAFVLREGKLKVAFKRRLSQAELVELRRIVETFYSRAHEFNLDVDDPDRLSEIMQKLKAKFPTEIFEIRQSSRHGYHIRMVRRRFSADDVIWLREQFGDDKRRLDFARMIARQGELALDFLYEIKRGVRSGEWQRWA